jgi:hypothetical protein
MKRSLPEMGSSPIHVQVVSSTPGRIRLKVSGEHRDPQAMSEIASTLKEFFPQIHAVRTKAQIGSITVYYTGENSSFTDALTALRDLGIIAIDNAALPAKSPATAEFKKTIVNLSQQLKQVKNDPADSQLPIAVTLGAIALWLLFSKGSKWKTTLGYTLGWYAIDRLIAWQNRHKLPPPSP